MTRIRLVVAGCVAALLLGVVARAADDVVPQMPKPQKEHQWLQQIVGEWEYEGECQGEPGKPPVKAKGTESGRLVGGFWAVLENKGEFMGSPFTGILTLGYDPEKKKYVGTWVDSMGSTLWQYEGALDSTGKILTLETEGPCPMEPGKLMKVRDIIEIKGGDHKVFKGTIEKDGKWETMMTMNYRRNK